MAADRLPHLTAAQMAEVDRAMIEDFGVSLAGMMENAGRNLAHLCRSRFFAGDSRDRRVIVLAGKGGNGGGALVAGRRLESWGADVQVYLTADPAELDLVSGQQLRILQAMSVPMGHGDLPNTSTAEVIVDGIIGYGLRGAPIGTSAKLIRWANQQDVPILSLDVPSGLDASTGRAFEPVIRATVTMTLALPKVGLGVESAREFVGELYLADIGVPPQLYARPYLNLDVGSPFAREELIRLG